MQAYQTWDNVLSYIKDELGADMMKLEFDDDKIIEKLNEHVIPFYSKWDGYNVFYKFTTNDLVNPESPTLIYKFADTFDYKILSVEGKIDGNSLWDDYNLSQYAMNSGDITDYLTLKNYQHIYEIIQPIDHWKFLPPDKFMVTRGNNVTSTTEFILVIKCVHKSPLTMDPTYDDYFKRLAAARIKILIGKIRKKFNNFNTPMGEIQLNADELVQEGTQEWNEVLTEIQNTPPDQMAWFF